MRTGKIKYAKLSNSPRLQRLHKLLSTGREYTTMQIIQLANIAVVSTSVCELRENGIAVNCRLVSCDHETGSRTYAYQLAA